MRNSLKPFEGFRYTYMAEFDRFGKVVVSGKEYKTVLLIDLKNIFGDYVCDHVWIREGKKFNKLNLNKGDKVQFTAVVKKYQHFKKDNKNIDYRLIHLYDIKKIT